DIPYAVRDVLNKEAKSWYGKFEKDVVSGHPTGRKLNYAQVANLVGTRATTVAKLWGNRRAEEISNADGEPSQTAPVPVAPVRAWPEVHSAGSDGGKGPLQPPGSQKSTVEAVPTQDEQMDVQMGESSAQASASGAAGGPVVASQGKQDKFEELFQWWWA